IFSHTAESCPVTYPPGRTLPARECASPAALLRWEFPGPSTTPAAPVHTALRSGRETRATWCDPTCCPPLLRRPAETLAASPPRRSPPEGSRSDGRGCSRPGAWESPVD